MTSQGLFLRLAIRYALIVSGAGMRGGFFKLAVAAAAGVLVAVTHLADPPEEESDRQVEARLVEAAGNGDLQTVSSLLEQGIDPNADEGRGLLGFEGETAIQEPTPLQEAARMGHLQVARALLKAGADPRRKGIGEESGQKRFPWLGERMRGPAWARQMLQDLEFQKRYTEFTCGHPMGAAALGGHLDMVKLLVEEEAISADDRELSPSGMADGWTALMWGALGKSDAVCRYLLDRGADPNLQSDEDGASALHYAAARRSPSICQLLLDRGADPSALDTRENTPMHYAAATDTPEAIVGLVSKGANPCAANESGFTPLHAAAANGAIASCQVLLDLKADPNGQDQGGRTALHLAALRGDGKQCETLLIGGANPRARTTFGETPLHLAAASGDLNTLILLIQAGCSVRSPSSLGLTPLHYAASYDRRPAAAILIQRGVLMNATAAEGFTPLHLAILQDSMGVIPLLLVLGAKPSPPDGEDWTPLHLAAFKPGPSGQFAFGHEEEETEVEETLTAAQEERLARDPLFRLLEHGANARARNLSGETPLHLAAFVNRADYCKLLLSAGCPVNDETREGLTPLDMARLAGSVDAGRVLLKAGGKPGFHPSPDMLRALLLDACRKGDGTECDRLLAAGADPNAAREGEMSPLCAAAAVNCSACAKLLCIHGANPNAPCPSGTPPLSEAVVRADEVFLRVLLEAGAKVEAGDGEGRTALHRAASNRSDYATPSPDAAPLEPSRDPVQILLDHGADPNFLDRWGRTPLHDAAEHGEFENVVLLVNHGANPNVAAATGVTPLDLAPEEEENAPGIGSFLRSRGAQPGKPESVKLFRAVDEDDFAAAKILLEAGADPNVVPSLRGTPLLLAAARNDTSFMEILVAHGARVNQDSPWKRTPLQMALLGDFGLAGTAQWLLDRGANGGRWGVMALTTSQADLLLSYGFSVDDIGPGISWLVGAVDRSDVRYVRYLLRRGADPDFRLRDGSTPLHHSVGGSEGSFDLRIVEQLLLAGGNPNARDGRGQTPGHAAAAMNGSGWFASRVFDGGIPLLELLAAYGADLSLRDYEGKTPRDLAHQRHGLVTAFWLRRWEVLKMLGMTTAEPPARKANRRAA
jgi:ankyrin repeat protein